MRSLRYFLNRSKVLAQYHALLRITAPLAGDVRADVRQQIRSSYEMYRHVDDEAHVARLIQQGKDQMKHVSDLVDSAVARQRVQATREVVATSVQSKELNDTGSWIESADSSSPDSLGDDHGSLEDVKGRLGVGWPWKSKPSVRKLELDGIKRR